MTAKQKGQYGKLKTDQINKINENILRSGLLGRRVQNGVL